MAGRSKEPGYGEGILLVLGATLLWSLSGLFVRELPALTGWQINCWRGLSTGVCLIAFFVFIHRRNAIAEFRTLPLVAVLTASGFFALGSTLYVTSLTLASTAVVSAIGAIAPLFTALLAWVFAGERPGIVNLLAAGVALAGVAIIFNTGLTSGHWLGVLVSICVAFNFAGQTVSLRRFRAFDMVPAIAIGGFAVFVIAAVFGNGLDVPLRAIGGLALMGLVQLAIPLVMFIRGARIVPAVTASLIALLDAVLNPFWSFLAVNEVPERTTIIGGSIMVAAVAGAILASSRLRFGQPKVEPV